MIDEKLLLKQDSFYFVVNNYDQRVDNVNYSILIEPISILYPNDPISPQVVVSNMPNEIGVCSDLTLDARNSQNLGTLLIFCFYACMA